MGDVLAGVTVLEIAQVITGPMAGLQLAELGADVIKVEPPGRGDSFRRWEGGEGDGVPASFAAYNRGKRSVTLDIKTEEGRDFYRRLAGRCDVVIENFRPGVMDAADLGPAVLRQRDPTLVYCSITGSGMQGPRAQQPTYDAVAQAASGLWSQFTDLRAPEPVGPPLADQLTALYASIAILAALERRRRTGIGSTVEVSMLSACLGFQTLALTGVLRGEPVPEPSTRARRSLTFAFLGSDGLPFCVHLSSPQKFWIALCGALDQSALAADPRFARKADRTAAYDELRGILQGHFSTHSRKEWLHRLEQHGVPAAPLFDLGEVVEDTQVAAIGMLDDGPDGRTLGSPITRDGERCRAAAPPPRLGEHTGEVLAELGCSVAEIDALREGGIV
ncbi:MAG: CaiB/BaiF CoA transferase family protein [Acidimicrobiales bacterium]